MQQTTQKMSSPEQIWTLRSRREEAEKKES